MSLLEVLQLIGYSTGAALHLWIGALLLRRRGTAAAKMERVLLALAISIGLWHSSNLFITLHELLGLAAERWATALRLADTLSVISITLCYSFVLHVHLYLWANAQGRPLTLTEHARVYLSYIPAVFLIVAVPPLWTGAYAPMIEKNSSFVLPFAIWAAYVMGLVAATDLLIARKSAVPRAVTDAGKISEAGKSDQASERRFLFTLAAAFAGIGLFILIAYGFGVGDDTLFGRYLKTLANLASLVPTALLAHHIYRYRYLELIIRDSLVVASFAVAVLVIYLYGIRLIGAWVTARYELRDGAVESLLILALALIAAPLRRWFERHFHNLFAREASVYREVVARIGAHAQQYTHLPDLLHFIAQRTQQGLGMRRIDFMLHDTIRRTRNVSDNAGDGERYAVVENIKGSASDDKSEEWMNEVTAIARGCGWTLVEEAEILRERGYRAAYALRREERTVGLMLIDATTESLTYDVRAVLEVLAGQVAIAIEDCWLMEENVQLERRLAEGERLAALGQLAATVAHEVKNPLSAIKSIAQVMREDEVLCGEYKRDLDLIVSETDRLNGSVTQLLTFARSGGAAPQNTVSRLDDLVGVVVDLFRMEANRRNVEIELRVCAHDELDGRRASALRDALANLLLNAIQATPVGKRIIVEVQVEENDNLLISVTDGGTGVAAELRERIWEPFFTTKQRGTGLGLAIVRKRIEEAGGTVRLAPHREHYGARFELRLPLTTL